jgi:glutamate--cysteine ligase
MTDETPTLNFDDARSHIARKVFSDHVGGPEIGSVGLEPEYLVFRVDDAGNPVARLPLEGDSSVLSALGTLLGDQGELKVDAVGPPPVYSLPDGGRITFEPGGQVEHSTAVHPTAAVAMADVDRVAQILDSAFQTEGASLASAGLDVWTDRSLVQQQLRADRYDCMAAYFHSRAENGELMMRHTGSFQVNLDLGESEVAEERWRLANLLTPVALASFACSPADGWQSRRAWAWQGLDPTRTGFPPCMLAGDRSDPGCCYADLALNADVLLFRAGADGKAAPGTAGFRFRDWIESGHPVHGFPSQDDLEYHLSTLFPEVRLRGFLEIRSADAVPLHLRAAQVVFWIGLLYDKAARQECLELLEPRVTLLHGDWLSSAKGGFAEKELQERAIRVWELALQGAGRLPAGYFRPEDMACAEQFFGSYVRKGRSPSDDLANMVTRNPGEALRWTLGR